MFREIWNKINVTCCIPSQCRDALPVHRMHPCCPFLPFLRADGAQKDQQKFDCWSCARYHNIEACLKCCCGSTADWTYDMRRVGVKLWTCAKNVCMFSVETSAKYTTPIFSCMASFYKNEATCMVVGCMGNRDQKFTSLRGAVEPSGVMDTDFMLGTNFSSIGFKPLHNKMLSVASVKVCLKVLQVI